MIFRLYLVIWSTQMLFSSSVLHLFLVIFRQTNHPNTQEAPIKVDNLNLHSDISQSAPFNTSNDTILHLVPIHTISAVWKNIKRKITIELPPGGCTERHGKTKPYFVSNFHSACLWSNIFAICRIVNENQHNRVREKVLVRPLLLGQKTT